MNALRKLSNRLTRNRSGTAATEFAVALPLLLTAGLYGAETANLALVNMRVSQVAMHIADNASRVGDTSQINNRRIFESDINDLLLGSNIQATGLDFYEHGRAIISSFEVYDSTVSCPAGGCTQTDGDLFIHWQRAKGKKVWTSSYGAENAVLPSGIGPTGNEVVPEPGGAVIFVEVAYDYQPLISSRFFGPTTITAISSFIVRDNRDLSGLKQRKPYAPDAVASPSIYDSYSSAGGSSGGGSSSSSGGSTSSSGGSTSSSGGSTSSSGGSTSSSGGSSGGGSSGGGGGSLSAAVAAAIAAVLAALAALMGS